MISLMGVDTIGEAAPGWNPTRPLTTNPVEKGQGVMAFPNVSGADSHVKRQCKSCHESKPLEEFPTYRAKGVEGRRHTCRACWAAKWNPVIVAHNSRYYHENKNGYRDRQKERTAAQHQADAATHHSRNRQYKKRHPQKHAAKVAVMMAVRSGKLKPMPCAVCGNTKSQAHHDDYAKPLDVIWLCSFHHGERHRLLNRYGDPSEWPESLRVREMPAVPAGGSK